MELLFDIVPGEVWLKESEINIHFYMTLDEYNNSLNKPRIDDTQQKLDALGEAITYLLQEVTA